MRILFICKHNRFRSKIAEAFFNKLNKNKKYKAKSAGIVKGSPINKKLNELAKEQKIKIKSRPKKIATNLLKLADIIIIVADNVSKTIFKNKKRVKVWKITDASIKEKRKVKKLISQIKAKVMLLIKELN